MKEDIKNKKVFTYFEEISSIPRGSKNNQRISNFLVDFAKEHHLNYVQDASLNVIITKEASQGMEACPTLILQGHMDMVCEKDSDIHHNFMEDGLELQWDDEFIFAKGTTLGGDDGIAIAYCLAILSDDTLVHPRLEMIFTTDEEIGMEGAMALDVTNLKGTYMINIDSEEEGIILTSCAGGLTGICTLPIQYGKKEGKLLNISIKGLLGGHSGTEIDKNRVNATILLGRLLLDLEKQGYDLVNIQGGLKDNAIPREAFATILVPVEKIYDVINEVKFITEKLKSELRINEPNLTIMVEQGEEKNVEILDQESKKNILFFLLQCPNGIQVMSANIEGLVESSLNLGIFFIQDGKAQGSFSIRSSVGSYKKFLSKKLKMLITYLGGDYATRGNYPAWEYKKDSKLRNLSVSVFKEMYGHAPEIEAIHAGLECGILSNKLKGIDIISIGPNILDIHTPQEKLEIASVDRVYDYLIQLIGAFAKNIPN